jgi:hypothetical protein
MCVYAICGVANMSRLTIDMTDRQHQSLKALAALEPVSKMVKSAMGGVVFVIQAWDVDRAEPRPDGQDREEDEALPV